jgi:hypothetical protein
MRFLVYFTVLFVETCLYAKAKELPLPSKGSTMDTPESLIEGVIPYKNRVYLTLFQRDVFIQVPFNGITDDQKKTFGEFSDSKRWPLAGPLTTGLWQGGDVVGNRIILLDGGQFRLAVFDEESGGHLNTRTVPWDKLRPPRDRGGEATKSEVAELRQRFTAAYKRTALPQMGGLAYDRYRWLGKDKTYFFVASRVKGFPILTLACEHEDNSACYVDRACFAETGDIDADSIAGIAVAENRRLFLLDANRSRIVEFEFSSCFHVSKRMERLLPKRIKQPSDIYIDDDQALWISSQLPDDYYNASVFVWQKAEWH